MFDRVEQLKKEIDKKRPFENPLINQLKDYYRIGLTYSSNALEGSTMTISETKVILEDGLTVAGKPLREVYEVTGHGEAYEFMFNIFKTNKITEDNIKKIHKLFYNKIDNEKAGQYREEEVIITGSKYPVTKPNKIEKEMKELCKWIENEREKYHPIEFATLLHKKFIFIHPFIDGNGRVARLIMNLALIQKGYMIAIIPPVLRNDYIMCLEEAHTNDKEFVKFICDRVVESEEEIMRLLGIEIPKVTNK